MTHPAQDPAVTYWTDGDGDTPVLQRPAEFAQLLALYAQRQPARVLEVGTYYGGTLKQWVGRAAVGAAVVAVDTFTVVDRRTAFAAWTPPSVQLTCVAGRSQDSAVVATVRDRGPYDWIFIDADHWYEAVAADWTAYAPCVAPGGIIVLHDILEHPAHPEIQVARLWRMIARSEPCWWTYVEDPAATWGGIGVVQR